MEHFRIFTNAFINDHQCHQEKRKSKKEKVQFRENINQPGSAMIIGVSEFEAFIFANIQSTLSLNQPKTFLL